MYCSDTTLFWNGDDTLLECSDLGLKPGEPHKICRGNDRECVENEPYQDCVRGPNHCFNSDAVQQYDSELHALDDMKVARLAIGVGDESNVSSGSALWMIDDKYVLKYKLYLLYNFVYETFLNCCEFIYIHNIYGCSFLLSLLHLFIRTRKHYQICYSVPVKILVFYQSKC